MSKDNNAKDKMDVTRRGTFTLAAAVAALGAGIGMRPASAQSGFLKLDGVKDSDRTGLKKSGKADHKVEIKSDQQRNQGIGFNKLENNRNKK